jgi:predicted ester cyclase
MTRTTTAVTSVLVAATVLGGTAAGTAFGAPGQPSDAAHESTHATSRADQKQLTRTWLQLWNGDYSQAKRIVSPDIRVHAALFDGGDGSAVKGPAGMVDLISQIRAAFPDLRFAVDVGPIIDGDHVVVRWIATGKYAGGFPGATAPVGTPVTFTGTDILRTKHGKIADYWLNADQLSLVTQLKVTAG